MGDGYGSANRQEHLKIAAQDLDGAANKLADKAMASLARRGLAGVCDYSLIRAIASLALRLIESGLEFDAQAERHELRRLTIGRKCRNPFSAARERQLVDEVEAAARRLLGRLLASRSYQRLCLHYSTGDKESECRAVRGRAARQIAVEYAKRRADFGLAKRRVRAHSHSGGCPPLMGFLGAAELADALGVHASRRVAFVKQLERDRPALGNDCQEVEEPQPHCPRFLYRAGSPKLRDLAQRYKKPKPR
jgi:hypothetical protein